MADQGKSAQTEPALQEGLAYVFEALGDPTRLKIFRLLMEREDLCVTEIANRFDISVPAASYQLKMMEVVGLVRRERTGKTICYELKEEDDLVQKIKRIIGQES